MRRVLVFLLIGILVFGTILGCNNSSNKQPLILATTTSLNDTGLLSYLLPQLTKQTGIKVKPIAVGSGEALEMGAKGDADIVLSHSPDKEEELLRNGSAIKRTSFMYNYFVIVGPKSDPAGISGAPSAEEAFKRISDKKQAFISRGDESGTNKKELKIWDKVGLAPIKSYYIKTGQGMLETLEVANEKEAYTLTDKATYLSSKKNLESLAILLSNKESLKNVYSLVELNPKKLQFNKEGAAEFKGWLLSKSTLSKISKFGADKYKEPLFTLMR